MFPCLQTVDAHSGRYQRGNPGVLRVAPNLAGLCVNGFPSFRGHDMSCPYSPDSADTVVERGALGALTQTRKGVASNGLLN